MDNRIDAAYGRQSVDRKDSISIESQLEFCRHELQGGGFSEYTDKGFSGKNTDRPQFQALIRDIKAGKIKRVVVYKLDRISRSILDFANMMELFQQYNVEFISSTEKFDTSTPMGRAMLNICIVFAQLERETIQKRVTDAYYSRCSRGFKMGGRTPYGFKTKPIVMEGVNTKQLAAIPDDVDVVRMMYDMYTKPETSLGDIARRLAELNIQLNKSDLQRITLSKLLRNPVYVQADMDVYEFFKSQGAVIMNDAADFTGLNACYLYQGRGLEKRKMDTIAGQMLVLAPHEGVVPSETWLACRRKAMGNVKFQPGRKAINSWLAGKCKCGKCGHALASVKSNRETCYLHCKKRKEDRGCEGAGTLRTAEVEALVYDEMVTRLREFRTLAHNEAAKGNPKVTALKVELAHVTEEIEKLIDTLTGANDLLMSYANRKIAELDAKKQSVLKQLADLAADEVSPERMLQISALLDDWDNTEFDDRRAAVDSLIIKVVATNEDVDIQWKI